MKKQFLYVANWKAYFSFNQARYWILQNKQSLSSLANEHTLVLCPSFDVLFIIAQELKETSVQISAQNCSSHASGPHTGQVLAISLKQMGCNYCIIGHSEVQKECAQDASQIVAKVLMLLAQTITPIICIGQARQEYEQGLADTVLEHQLKPILQKISTQSAPHKTIAIAYEPLWAIGTGIIPETEHLSMQLENIKKLAHQCISDYELLLLYGGSVDENNIKIFKSMPSLNGVLIGGASTDFQKLEKIVLSKIMI